MLKRISSVLTLVLAFTLVCSSIAWADEQGPDERVRVRGRISSINLSSQMFTLTTGEGDDIRVQVSGETQFRSPSGKIQSLEDLEEGMAAIVVGIQHGQGLLEAAWVAAADLGQERPEIRRAEGEISAIDLDAQTFTLTTRQGEAITFQTSDRTHYRGPQGSIEGLEDLEIGMRAMVGAVEVEGDLPLALLVIAARPEDVPDNGFRLQGVIASIVAGQGTFTVVTGSGETVEIATDDNTRFQSRDGSVEDIHDLARDMRVGVAGLIQEDGTRLALIVIAGSADRGGGRSGQPNITRFGGHIVSIAGSSFTVEKPDGSQVTVSVDESTTFRSRDGSIQGLADLEIGMVALVGARSNEDGSLTALWIGAGKLNNAESGGVRQRPESDV